jgi:hypothetical protein
MSRDADDECREESSQAMATTQIDSSNYPANPNVVSAELVAEMHEWSSVQRLHAAGRITDRQRDEAMRRLTGVPDLSAEDHGSIVRLVPQTIMGVEWIEANIDRDGGYQPDWPTVLLEPRYVEAILDGAREAGLGAQWNLTPSESGCGHIQGQEVGGCCD